MDTKNQISVDADALRQVLSALNGPGHHIRELQVIRGLPSLGGVSHDPIGTLVKQFNEFANAPPATAAGAAPKDAGNGPFGDLLSNLATPPMPRVVPPRADESDTHGSAALDAMRLAKDSLSEILSSTGDVLIKHRDHAKDGDLHSDDAYDRASAAISALDACVWAGQKTVVDRAEPGAAAVRKPRLR